MSAYSTLDVTRERAEEMVKACRAKNDNSVKVLSDKELEEELNGYAYSEEEKYRDVIGFLYNYMIQK